MLDKVMLIDENGETQQVDLVSVFSINQKKYSIIKINEKDPNGLDILHVSEIVNDKLIPIPDDNIWQNITNLMRSIVSSSNEIVPVYEPSITQANIEKNSYSRDIAVQTAAVDVMVNDYQTKKPATVVEQTGTENNIISNSLDNIYPVEGGTPVVQNMNNIPLGNTIAPGINEIAVDAFQPVSQMENPVDLIINNQPIENSNLNNVGMNQIPQDIMYNNQNIQQVIPNNSDGIDTQLQELINSGATEEQIRETVIQKLSAIITNYVDFVGMKTAKELSQRKAELDKREAELNIMKQGIEAKLSGQFSGQQQFYPNSQNGIVETPMGNVQQPFNQQMVYQQPTDVNNFRPMA